MARSVAEIEKLRKDTEGGKVYRAEVNTSASAEAVYDVLTDLQTHLQWTGLKGREGLITMEGPPPPLEAGMEFRSTGGDNFGTWSDRSIITETSRPSAFEFITDGKMTYRKEGREAWRATNVHRYEITPTPSGTQIAYTFRSVRASNAPALVRSRLLSPLMNMAGKASLKRALKGLASMAELGSS